MTQNPEKLLILGAYRSEKEIIDEAHRMGLYVIVTDNHENYDDAPAKYLADEAWNISWTDMESLADACRKSGVNGIMAGFSELRVRAAARLASILGLPFYAEGADLTTICEKSLFKSACLAAGVTVPKKYEYGGKIDYPVIVKPADNGGSRGITICFSPEELDAAHQKACAASNNGEALIEQYLSGDEVMIYFSVHNGKAEFSAMCDRHMKQFDRHITQLPVAYSFPSSHLPSFREKHLESFRKLIASLGIRNGLIAFQAFAVGEDFIPFDPTYRLDGTMAYHIIEEENGINVLRLLLNQSMTGRMGDEDEIAAKESPDFSRPALELPILVGKGTIGSVSGFEEISSMKNVIHVYQSHCVGDVMKYSADFSQIFCRIHLVADSVDELAETAEKITSTLTVLDTEKNDMILFRPTPEEIRGYF